MSWDKLIISQKSSKMVKEKIIELNSIDNFEGKYIGIIPIYWDSLNIHKKNQYNQYKKDFNLKTVDQCGCDLENLKIDDSITNIYTTKEKLIVMRELYYIVEQHLNYFPVVRYDNSLTFSMREIKKFIGKWLKLNGFSLGTNEEQFELFRIYKMNGFHLFTVILHSKSNLINNGNCMWGSNYNMELLPLVNNEIINPFMKVSQYKYSVNNTSDIWNQYIEGYFEKDKIIPFKIKWSEILATVSNIIDSDSSENIHLYFKCNIMTTTSEIFPKKQKLN
jgi:hypothetical protein